MNDVLVEYFTAVSATMYVGNETNLCYERFAEEQAREVENISLIPNVTFSYN